MSRPTSKKESKQLLEFFNSIKSEKDFDNGIESITILFYLYLFSVIYILYNLFSVFF